MTDKEAFLKAQKYCVYRERCHKEVRDKLCEWGILPEVSENIIAGLITANFINEERFARAYAGGKFRIKKWGRIKIKKKLQSKNISKYCIKMGLEEIDENDYLKSLKYIIEKKVRSLDIADKYIKNDKIAKYAISKGFEPELVWDILKDKK